MNNPTTDQPDELRRVLQEAERSQRSAEARKTTIREDSASVTFNVWPQLIPRDSIDPASLINAVQNAFHANLDIGRLMQRVPDIARGQIDVVDMLSHALHDDDTILHFGSGFLSIPESRRVTTIRYLRISEENISASVVGSSSEAEYCLRRLAVILGEAAGVPRSWDDFSPHIEMRSYNTTTVVDLGKSLKNLLAPSIREFIDSEVGGTSGFGTDMGGFASLDLPNMQVVPSVLRIEFRINAMDITSGRSETCSIEILNHTRVDANGPRVRIQTELRSDVHQKFVEQLTDAVTNA